MADLLAKQSFSIIQAIKLDSTGLCVDPSHSHECPSLMAFHNVNLSDVNSFLMFINEGYVCCQKKNHRRSYMELVGV
jgi:hypothetical protein